MVSSSAPSRLIEEGRTRRHDTWSAGCGGRDSVARARDRRAASAVSDQSAQDERRCCVRQNRVVPAPVAGVKSAEVFAGPTGSDKTVNSPMTVTRRIRRRGEHGISRKAIVRGMPECSDCTCMLVCVSSHNFAHETAGAASTRHSLRPLSGRNDLQSPGESRRGNAEACFGKRQREGHTFAVIIRACG